MGGKAHEQELNKTVSSAREQGDNVMTHTCSLHVCGSCEASGNILHGGRCTSYTILSFLFIILLLVSESELSKRLLGGVQPPHCPVTLLPAFTLASLLTLLLDCCLPASAVCPTFPPWLCSSYTFLVTRQPSPVSAGLNFTPLCYWWLLQSASSFVRGFYIPQPHMYLCVK